MTVNCRDVRLGRRPKYSLIAPGLLFGKRTTQAVRQWGYLRPVTQADAGHAVPSTGAAAIRRKQRAKAEARRLADWMRQAGL